MNNYPPCGLYKTLKALPGKEEWVRENLLVYFHNHSQQGLPLLLLPAVNMSNRWSFQDKGYLIREDGYLDSLMKLKAEGYYVLNEAIHLSHEEMIPSGTLAQLGYNRAGDPILFLAEFSDKGIVFPQSGLKCTTDVFELLTDVNFSTPNFPDPH